MLSRIINKIDFIDEKISSLSNKVKLIILILIGVILFSIILKLNILTLMWADDFVYSFVMTTSDRIESLTDVIRSQYIHYMLWGGRSVAHTILQLILMLDPLLIDFLNSLVFISLICLMYMHIKGKGKRHDLSVFILIILFVWFFVPAFDETILWITGSCNYLWCTTIILLFLLPYRLYDGASNSKVYNVLKSCFMFIGGIIAGWTNENVGIGMVIMVAMWIFSYRKQGWNIPYWAIFGIIGAIIGYVLMTYAPGNYARLDHTIGGRSYNLFYFYYTFNMITANWFDIIGFPLALSGILIFLTLKFGDLNRNKFIYQLSIYFVGIFLPIYAMIPVPFFSDRSSFGSTIFLIILFGILYNKLNTRYHFLKYIRISILSLFMFAFIFNFYRSYKEVKYVHYVWSVREEKIKTAKENNEVSVSIPIVNRQSRYALTDNIMFEGDMSRYYGIKIKME